jgi:hypothetical protein
MADVMPAAAASLEPLGRAAGRASARYVPVAHLRARASISRVYSIPSFSVPSMKIRASAVLLLGAMSASLAAQPSSPINFGALVPRTDSFVVMVQGNPLGFQRTSIERTEAGLRIVDDVQIGPIMTQHTEVELAADGSLRSTKQTGQVRGHNTSIDITYHDGRAKGSATTPSMAGLVTIAIDTTVIAGAIDDNLITALLPAMDWSPTASMTVPVFLSGKGYVQSVTLTVKGIEKLTVPAGSFEVYRVELSGGQAPVAMFLTTDSAHRLVKIAPQGAPLEFVLVK